MIMKKNTIYLIHGTEYERMTEELLERARVAEEIGDTGKAIVLKPNLVTAVSADSGATTHPELLAGTISYLRAHGFRDITIMEGSWVGCGTGSAFRSAGYDAVCKRFDVPFFDTKKDSFRTYDCRGMQIAICDRPMAADYLINMPVLKGHGQTLVTCALKNMKGIIPDQEKRRFHTIGLHQPIAHLNTVVRHGFILVDNICGDLDFEEGGNPVTMNRVLGFRDPVLCDAFVCETMGYTVDDVPYVRIAEQLGVGSTDLARAETVFLNEAAETAVTAKPSRRIQRLAAHAAPKDACSACYGSLIYALQRLEEEGALPAQPVAVGQGYQGQSGNIGVGRCTSCFTHSLPGCPPKTSEIVQFLKAQ